jgi:hypothetical protein
MPAGFGATVIFDDLGRAWRPGDPALTRWLGTAGPGAFTPDDLVRKPSHNGRWRQRSMSCMIAGRIA